MLVCITPQLEKREDFISKTGWKVTDRSFFRNTVFIVVQKLCDSKTKSHKNKVK